MRIEVKNLNYIYDKGLPFETAALRDISFTVDSGEFVCLLGHTGSGKSTLIQLLNGLLRPTEGCVLIDGQIISGKGKGIRILKNKIGMVFQYPEYQLFEENVFKDVCYGPANLGFSPEETENKAKKALDIMGIPEEKFGVSPFSLSGGEKRRVAIAGVLAMKPEILILDEPTAGLDPQGQRDIIEIIRRIKNMKNYTIFLVTHSMELTADLADRILVLNDGVLKMNGGPEDVFSRGDELEAMGLAVPAPALFLRMLKKKGLDVQTDRLSTDAAADEIVRVLSNH